MKYIFNDENEITQYGDYFEYILSISHVIPKALFEFVSDVERYDLHSSKTLHDSWIEKIDVCAPSFSFEIEGSEFELLEYSLELILFNRRTEIQHTLTYQTVSSVEMRNLMSNRIRPVDLLAHEFRIEKGEFVHEFIFENAGLILISCGSILHSEEERIN